MDHVEIMTRNSSYFIFNFMSNLWNLSIPGAYQDSIISNDRTGQYESFPKFPQPLSNELIDECSDEESESDSVLILNQRLWMPDNICSRCNECGEPFNFLRRRHHCRVCGDVFCHTCTASLVEGSLVGIDGTARCCRSCYGRVAEQTEKEHASYLNILTSEDARFINGYVKCTVSTPSADTQTNILDYILERKNHLQKRAKEHHRAMMLGLLREIIPALADHQTWLDTIFNLTDSIVDSVTPDVRRGEDLNINSYVDVITVPGGHLSDTRLVQGVVLRKEFVHRKMKSQDLQRPVRYLIIESGIGIEGDRTDKLAELGHIGEHEDKVLDFLLTRILSRRPDVLLLGAGICYAALKQLHAKGVLVVQNIEARKLQWIGRLTGAECLKSADYVTLPGVAYGNDPIGFSARFEVVRVQDDPECQRAPREGGILLSTLGPDCTYMFIEGCEKQRGCSVFLRGGDRTLLNQVSELLRRSVLLAYHLRLETAFYLDRDLSAPSADVAADQVDNDSDEEEAFANPLILPLEERKLLSSSLDVDYVAPRAELEVIGDDDGGFGSATLRDPSVTPLWTSLQGATFTTLLSGEGTKATAERRQIEFYGQNDCCLGRFLCDEYFQPNAPQHMQTRSFMHSPGRIELTVSRQTSNEKHPSPSHLTYFQQILLWAYCKECKCKVTTTSAISDSTWSLSFGKFLDLCLYNRAATGSSLGCPHRCRESHVLNFASEGLVVAVEFVPMHSYALKVRNSLPFHRGFHTLQTKAALRKLLERSCIIFEDFASITSQLTKELLASAFRHPDSTPQLLSETAIFQRDQTEAATTFQQTLLQSISALEDDELDDHAMPVYFRYPMGWKRDLLLLCDTWNATLLSIYDRLDEIKIRDTPATDPFSFFKLKSEETQDPTYSDSYRSTEDKQSMLDLSRLNEGDAAEPDTSSSSFAKVFSLWGATETRERRRGVALGDIADQYLYLYPGRRGEVVPVNPDEPASLIAYSLASKEYAEQVQRFRSTTEEISSKSNNISGRVSPYVHNATSEKLSPSCSAEDLEVAQMNLAQYSLDAYERTETPEIEGFDVPIARPRGKITFGPLLPPVAAEPLVESDESVGSQSPAGSVFDDDEYTAPSPRLERQLVLPRKSHVKHVFGDSSGSGSTSKFTCYTFWSTQFEALRRLYLGEPNDDGYIRSLASSALWVAQGGKSGASFAKSCDERFVVKAIYQTELQMFNDFAPAYFEYMSKALFHGLPTVLCKIFGVHQLSTENRQTGKKTTEYLIVMENLFYEHKPTRVFDLKGSTRARYVVDEESNCTFEEALHRRRRRRKPSESWAYVTEQAAEQSASPKVLLDDNFIQLNCGRPFPLRKRAKEYLDKAVRNDSMFLSVINVVDYSILAGVDESSYTMRVGIIDYMRQYDIIKKMEHMGKSVGMLTGQGEPTIIEPAQYKKRLQLAIDRYFMEVPDKWSEADRAAW